MTVFSEALAKAGIDTDAARLAVMANDILARFGISPQKAREEFSEILRKDEGLRSAIAELYLTQRAADMRGDSLIGGGQTSDAPQGQVLRAPAGQSVGGDGGQTSPVSTSGVMPSSPPPKADHEGHSSSAAPVIIRVPSRSAPKRSVEDILADCGGGSGQQIYASSRHVEVTPSAAPPRDPAPWRPSAVNKPRGLAAMVSAQAPLLKSVFDTYKVRGNLPIGDLSWMEAKSLARLNECEARVLRYITDHVANARPGALIRDVVKVEVVENAIRLASEAANAAA
jgi:hypothetical protein